MKNTKLKAIFDISEEINSTSEQYSDLLDAAASNKIRELLIDGGNLTLTGRSGLAYNFSALQQDDREITVHILGQDVDETIYYDVSDPIEDWEVVQGNESYTYQDIIADISDQYALQNTYGSLANHLTTSVRISDSHLDSIVHDKEFRDLLVDYSKDGYLSQTGFLSALQQMYEATKDVCETEGAIDIDDSRPGYLKGIGAIFTTLVPALAQIVGLVVALFSRILGFIFIAIGSVLQALFTKAEQSESFTYDIEADTDYLNYPIYANYNEVLNISSDDVLRVYEVGAMDCYLHKREDYRFDVNAFMSLRYHVGRTNTILSQAGERYFPLVEQVSGEGFENTYEVWNEGRKLMNLPNECYLTLEEKYDLLSNEQDLLDALAFNVMISFGSLISHDLGIIDAFTRIRYATLDPTDMSCANFSRDTVCRDFFKWCYLLQKGMAKPVDTTWTYIYDFITFIRDVALTGHSFTDPTGLLRVNLEQPIFVCSWANPLNDVAATRSYVTNNIPDSRFINLPQIEPGTFRNIAIMTAIITTVTLISVTAFSRKMHKSRTRRAIRKSGELSQLKQQYETDPTAENEAAYVNAVLRQNRRAKIFGGAVYDPSNGWFETSNTSSTLTLPVLNQIKRSITG